jgi:hypothetical protein
MNRHSMVKHFPVPDLQSQLVDLGTLVQLLKRARHAETVQELAFVIVNETHSLLPYRQAALWRAEPGGSGSVVAISGTPVVERNAPFTLWLMRMLSHLATHAGSDQIVAVDAGSSDPQTRADWAEWLPAFGLWAPLNVGHGQGLTGLFIARAEPWTDADRHLIQELADGYGHAWAARQRGRSHDVLSSLRRRANAIKIAAAFAVFIALWLPISLSALAPAEIVPLNPEIVRAPLEGVVDHFEVKPNDTVKEGQLLLELDRRSIENKLEVAKQAFAVAEAEYRQAAQQALFDEKSRSQLAVLNGRAEQRRADVNYAQSLLDRIRVTAVKGGIAIFEDPNDWIGRPVTIGERLLEIADPNAAELEIWLPVADAITLKPGAEVEFFLNVAPSAPLSGKLRQTSYEATLSPSGLLGYRLKAELTGNQSAPRIGLRGTAKIYGDRVTLFYYLLRRPIAALRQLTGL